MEASIICGAIRLVFIAARDLPIFAGLVYMSFRFSKNGFKQGDVVMRVKRLSDC